MTETFKREQAEQQSLLLKAQRGELGVGAEAAQVSPVAAAAAARGRVELRRRQRAHVDRPLPPLAEESGRTWKADADSPPSSREYDSQEDVKTRVTPPTLPHRR